MKTQLAWIRGAIPVIVLGFHAAVYGNWIIDDAGITYAYARNLAEGHGFVAQVGDPPVEGFTNLLWMLVLAASMATNLFHTVLTSKVLGVALAASAVLLVRQVARRSWPQAGLAIDIAAIVTCANPAFAIWCSSGLENGLTAALLGLACWQLDRALPRPRIRDAVASALLAGLLFANRPDGALFAAVFPITVWVASNEGFRKRMGLAAIHIGLAAACMACLTLWRWAIFEDVVPNTFHAKVDGSGMRTAIALFYGVVLAALLLSGSWFARSRLGSPLRALLILATVFFMDGKHSLSGMAPEIGWCLLALGLWLLSQGPQHGMALKSFAIMALVHGYAMPMDWMGESRFKTPILLFALQILAAATIPYQELWRAKGIQGRWLTWSHGILGIALLSFLVINYTKRAENFRVAPTVPMQDVEDQFARHFVVWARLLEDPDATVLTPDIGGPLWSNQLRIHDLAGLCDQQIARLIGKDRRKLADLILEEMKPTFITMHGSHAWQSGLTDHERFARDYVGIETWIDTAILESQGQRATVGRFVRRDALTSGVTVETLRDAVRDHR